MRYWKAGHRPPLRDDHVFIVGLGIGDVLYLVFNGPPVEGLTKATVTRLDGTPLPLLAGDGSGGVEVVQFAMAEADPVSQLDVELSVEGVSVLRVRINRHPTSRAEQARFAEKDPQ